MVSAAVELAPAAEGRMRMGRAFSTLAVAPLALVALAGCNRMLLPGAERCQADGGRPWREYRSAHFVVDSDLDVAAAAALVDDLERIRALVTAALVGKPLEIPGYVRVVVPVSMYTFRAIAPEMTLGWFGVDGLGEPTVVLHPEVLRRDPEVIAHELTHHLSWYIFPRQPRWFAEGIAGFAQTVASKDGPYPSNAGLVPRGRAAHLLRAEAMTAREILEPDRVDGDFELWSWVLYHWLWNERSHELSEYQRRLGLGEEPLAAWRASFPEFAGDAGLAKLTEAIDDHRRKGRFMPYLVHAEWSGAFSTVPLGSADVHMLLLDVGGAPTRGVLRGQVLAALQEDPTHPVALLLKASIDRASPVPPLRAASASRPGDWRAWLLLADALEGEERQAERGVDAGTTRVAGAGAAPEDAGREAERRERLGAYRRAVELNPSSFRAHAGLARELAGEGSAVDAVPHARQAVELSPSNPEAIATLARVAADVGECVDARPLLARATDLLPKRGAAEARRQLAEVTRRCGSAVPPAGRTAP
jgi:tetratricopeptide (TPR) repeat protein